MKKESDLRELRLFLAELCCNLCRFQHLLDDKINPEDIKISQEVYLGDHGAFADIQVQLPEAPPYFIEIKYGYTAKQLWESFQRKYRPNMPRLVGQSCQVIVVVDDCLFQEWERIAERIQKHINSELKLEVWNEEQLLQRCNSTFTLELRDFSATSVRQLRTAMDRTKGVYAFGGEWINDSLHPALLWHFGFWRLKQLCEEHGFTPTTILKPGLYRNVVVLMVDFCSFSSFVRDTRDDEVVRECLTAFYSKARYEVLNTGGMMYQFVGDQVIGLFGFPTPTSNYLREAMDCARTLCDIGTSVSHQWQRMIDRVQVSKGVHIAITIGDLQMVYLRPYGRTRIGAVSDSVNMASRLLHYADSGEIVVSNSFFQRLDDQVQAQFSELSNLDARNIGVINAWKVRAIKS